MICVQKLGSTASGDIFDSVFGLTILVMGIGPTEGQSLICLFNGGFKDLTVEQSVVRVVVTNSYYVRGRDLFKGQLRFKSGSPVGCPTIKWV
jgi:hypothetical protein